jgi:hypothetical protein
VQARTLIPSALVGAWLLGCGAVEIDAPPTFECAGDVLAPIECVTGEEVCLVFPAREDEPVEGGIPSDEPSRAYDEVLECLPYPKECAEFGQSQGWCDCVALLVCPECYPLESFQAQGAERNIVLGEWLW